MEVIALCIENLYSRRVFLACNNDCKQEDGLVVRARKVTSYRSKGLEGDCSSAILKPLVILLGCHTGMAAPDMSARHSYSHPQNRIALLTCPGKDRR